MHERPLGGVLGVSNGAVGALLGNQCGRAAAPQDGSLIFDLGARARCVIGNQFDKCIDSRRESSSQRRGVALAPAGAAASGGVGA